jgi:hypothetical protein
MDRTRNPRRVFKLKLKGRNLQDDQEYEGLARDWKTLRKKERLWEKRRD